MSDEIRCINIGYVVSKDNSKEIEKFFKEYASLIENFYSNDSVGQMYLLNSYFTKAPETDDTSDPSKGEIENIVFTVNERFTSLESVRRHLENLMKKNYFEEFGKILQNYVKIFTQGGVIYHSIR